MWFFVSSLKYTWCNSESYFCLTGGGGWSEGGEKLCSSGKNSLHTRQRFSFFKTCLQILHPSHIFSNTSSPQRRWRWDCAQWNILLQLWRQKRPLLRSTFQKSAKVKWQVYFSPFILLRWHGMVNGTKLMKRDQIIWVAEGDNVIHIVAKIVTFTFFSPAGRFPTVTFI